MFLLLIFPFSVFAKTYEVKNTNTKMTIDDKNWDVFTLDDTNDNELIKRYHITIEIAKKYAYENNIFLQAEKTDFNDFLFVAFLFEKLEIEKIIDSIELNDLYYNKGNTNIKSDKTKINWSNIIIASVSSGIGAVVMNLVLKKFKK